jgi:hypothetical protein
LIHGLQGLWTKENIENLAEKIGLCLTIRKFLIQKKIMELFEIPEFFRDDETEVLMNSSHCFKTFEKRSDTKAKSSKD